MPIIGFNFTKLSVEKKNKLVGQLKVKNRFLITNVEATELALGKSKQKVLNFSFSFTSKYEPAIGDLVFEGEVLFLAEPKTITEAISEWKKDKKMLPEIGKEVVNVALNKCSIEALILSRDINIPPPVPLPNLQSEQQNKDYIG